MFPCARVCGYKLGAIRCSSFKPLGFAAVAATVAAAAALALYGRRQPQQAQRGFAGLRATEQPRGDQVRFRLEAGLLERAHIPLLAKIVETEAEPVGVLVA